MSEVIDHGSSVTVEAASGTGKTLDPLDWKSFRAQAHDMLDDMVSYIENIRERPVWQPIPDAVRAQFRAGVPALPMELGAAHDEFMRDVLPFAAGNVHPGFMGWVHGGGTPVGMMAETRPVTMSPTLGMYLGRRTWARRMFGSEGAGE